MSTVKITKNKVGPIKPMHAGGQPPLNGVDTSLFQYVADAGIPYSRLHDVFGAYGANRYVDIPNIFRDFSADENDPASYDFAFTDYLISELVRYGIEPYFRLGVTIENYFKIKAYRIDPPADYDKWARICEHIIMHYTEGWADGFEYKITYWEIWNEPENDMMWTGTKEDYYRLYDVTSKHLKARFPHLKIGGYASCGFYAIAPTPDKEPSELEKYFIDFFYGFMEYIKEHGCPIDFFSWHTYSSTKRAVVMDRWLHDKLVEYGYGDIELHLNEWDPFANERGTAHHSAEVAATMIAMQNGYTDLCCIYDMRANYGTYTPLFSTEEGHEPRTAYYSFVAFNQLYKLGDQLEAVCDTEELYTLAATDGKHCALMLSNLTEEDQTLEIDGVDLSCARFYVLNESKLLAWAPNAKRIARNEVMLIEWDM